jgi:hypothetical protein
MHRSSETSWLILAVLCELLSWHRIMEGSVFKHQATSQSKPKSPWSFMMSRNANVLHNSFLEVQTWRAPSAAYPAQSVSQPQCEVQLRCVEVEATASEALNAGFKVEDWIHKVPLVCQHCKHCKMLNIYRIMNSPGITLSRRFSSAQCLHSRRLWPSNTNSESCFLLPPSFIQASGLGTLVKLLCILAQGVSCPSVATPTNLTCGGAYRQRPTDPRDTQV